MIKLGTHMIELEAGVNMVSILVSLKKLLEYYVVDILPHLGGCNLALWWPKVSRLIYPENLLLYPCC